MTEVIDQQSKDSAIKVRTKRDSDDMGEANQSLRFRYTTDETEEYMPLAVFLAHGLNKKIVDLIRYGPFSCAMLKTKTQVTIEYGYDYGASHVSKRIFYFTIRKAAFSAFESYRLQKLSQRELLTIMERNPKVQAKNIVDVLIRWTRKMYNADKKPQGGNIQISVFLKFYNIKRYYHF